MTSLHSQHRDIIPLDTQTVRGSQGVTWRALVRQPVVSRYVPEGVVSDTLIIPAHY